MDDIALPPLCLASTWTLGCASQPNMMDQATRGAGHLTVPDSRSEFLTVTDEPVARNRGNNERRNDSRGADE